MKTAKDKRYYYVVEWVALFCAREVNGHQGDCPFGTVPVSVLLTADCPHFLVDWQIAQPFGRRFRRNVALLFREQLEADHELRNRCRA